MRSTMRHEHDAVQGIALRRLAQTSEDGDSDTVESYVEDDEVYVIEKHHFDHDIFGMLVCSLVRDLYHLQLGKGTSISRLARCATTSGLLFICVFTQVFLLEKLLNFVAAQSVHDIRIAYDHFELHMYNETYLTVNGKHRGRDGYFMPERFATLSGVDQAAACRIPLSQPDFFFCVLFIWTITCLGEIKACLYFSVIVLFELPPCPSLREAKWNPDKDSSDDHTAHEFVIVGLPRYLKALILTVVVLPRLGVTAFLLWVGCRWLLATNNFAELILNAVALEFILILKEMVYHTLVPHRNKIDLVSTFIKHKREEPADAWSFTNTLCWGVVAIVWVVSYMGIPHHMQGWQMVLPEYRWDVHEVCAPWIKWRYCVNPPCPESLHL